MTATVCTVNEAINYSNEAVIDKFLTRYPMSYEDARDIFDETKKWLWLCAISPDGVDLMINDSLFMIDEMWHTFILFTMDYTDYCQSNFGRYIHHAPVIRSEREEAAAQFSSDPEAYREVRRQRFTKLFGAIYELLGRSTLYKWQVMYREKYSVERREKFGATPVSSKNLTPTFPLTEKNLTTFNAILYGERELEKDDLIQTLVEEELHYTSRWPNHGCGAYCSCSKAQCRTPD